MKRGNDPIWSPWGGAILSDEARRAVVVGPPDGGRLAIVQDLLDLGYGVVCATSVEATLALVGDDLIAAVVIQVSQFPRSALKRLARGMLAHPAVCVIGAVSIFSAVQARRSSAGRSGGTGFGRHSLWQRATCWAGFDSPKQLSRGLSWPFN